MSTWAIIEDLYSRLGEEYVNKLAIRNDWDEDTESYVANEDPEVIETRLNQALLDAKNLILQKLTCLYTNVELLDEENFPAILIWHVRTTVEVLKAGGDCTSCNCEQLDNFIKCNSICATSGVCLTSKKTFLFVSEAKFKCECMGVCSCC